MRIWQIVALLIAGVITGLFQPYVLGGFFSQLTLYLFLPALLFEAAWNLDGRVMLREWKPIALLAVPGVVLTALIVGVAAHLAGLPWTVAFLLGAILSATDPIAVVAIFKQLDVPKALATIVQSESLLNDAMAVVLYRVLLAAVLIGVTVAGSERLIETAVLGAFAGIALGAVIGWLFSLLLRERFGVVLPILASVAGAYGSYYIADHFNFSGIFATLACGIALRQFGSCGLGDAGVVRVEQLWDRVAAAANAVLFFLIGAASVLTHLFQSPLVIAATLAGIALARGVLAYGLLSLARPWLSWGWMHVVRVAGVRGALSLALAIALPTYLPDRAAIVDAVFAVVLVTILVSALRIERTVARLEG
ncbi:MAG: sodium:proton antiporter [Candidatus Baltobacteraceae bacterium]